MSLEYFMETKRLQTLEAALSREFDRIKRFRFPKLGELYWFSMLVIGWAEYDYDDKTERRIHQFFREMPRVTIRILILVFLAGIVLAGVFEKIYFGLISFASPLLAYVMVWLPNRALAHLISVLEKGPKGIVATTGFILFVLSSILSIYLAVNK